MVRREAALDSAQNPLPLAPPYSAEWTGTVYVRRRGPYQMRIDGDGSFLYLDGALVVDNGGTHGAKGVEASVGLSRGFHEIRVRYFETFGSFLMELRWTPPGGEDTPIPVDALFYRLPAAAPTSVVPTATQVTAPRYPGTANPSMAASAGCLVRPRGRCGTN